MAASAPAHIRPFQPGDRTQVLALAPRLTEGAAPWRDPAAVRRAAQNWVQTSIDAAAQPGRTIYVAVASGQIVGIVSIREQTHFTGQTDAYVGELAVAPGMERRGIATALMNAAETWAAQIVALANGPVWSVGEQDSGSGFHSAIDRICPVAVNDQEFTPEHSSVALGETAAWRIVSAAAPVSIRDTTGLIRSGFTGAGGSLTYGFSASGTYLIHAAGGGGTATSSAAAPATTAVSPEIQPAGAARATVRWALSAAASRFVFDVQIRRPGTTRFVGWKTGTRLAAATFTADRGAGAYAFRARVRRIGGAGATGYSPPVAIHLR